MLISKLKTALSSTFVWILVLLVGTNIAWGLLRPLKSIPHTAQPPAFLTKAATAYKFQRLEEQKSPPDFMIVGSSLPMCALFYGECPPYFDLAEGKRVQRARLNLLQAYPFSGYMTHVLSKEFNKKTSVFNFSIAACMVSDARVILDRTIASGKAPKTIIFGVGLRDFVDNMNPPPGETPIYTALSDAGYLMKNLNETVGLPAFPHLLLSSLCKMYGLRNECKLAFETNLAHLFQRQTNLEIAFKIASMDAQIKGATKVSATPAQKPAAVEKTKATETKQPAANVEVHTNKEENTRNVVASTRLAQNKSIVGSTKKASIKNPFLSTLDYMQRYGPANYRHLDREMHDLSLFIDRCHEQGIKIVVINMPVSSGHPAVSPPGLRERYLRDLEKTAAKADLYMNYENTDLFEDADFFDTVHLNYNGSHKFVDDLVKRYKSSPLYTKPQ